MRVAWTPRHFRGIFTGTPCALHRRIMAERIDNFEQLVAWQLSMELADLIDAMVAGGPASRNKKFRDQIQDASAKAAPQIAEGFLRFLPKESAYYYRIARASLGETQTHLRRGHRRKYWPDDVFKKAWTVSEGALKTTTGLLTSRLEAVAREREEKRRRSTARRPPSRKRLEVAADTRATDSEETP